MRKYRDGTPIPDALPPSYKNYLSPSVPYGQRCGTCKYYSESYCNKFLAPVKRYYWCKSWEEKND